jgi:hypothetical protein
MIATSRMGKGLTPPRSGRCRSGAPIPRSSQRGRRATKRRLDGAPAAGDRQVHVPYLVPSNQAAPAVLSGSAGTGGPSFTGASSPYQQERLSADSHGERLVTLSRWRHGFEPRWGCKGEGRGRTPGALRGSVDPRDTTGPGSRAIPEAECRLGHLAGEIARLDPARGRGGAGHERPPGLVFERMA